MQKGPLIGISIIAVIILVLGSLTNVVGYQAVQFSNQKLLKDEIDQKELLFQTIIDIVNNKKIQKIIQNSENIEGLKRFPQLSFIKIKIYFNVLLPPFLIQTKNYLDYTYYITIKLSKILYGLTLHRIIEHPYLAIQKIQNEIVNIIEKNDKLKIELEQLSYVKCDCENDNTTNWRFPIFCTFLYILFWFAFILLMLGINNYLVFIIGDIGKALNCFWPSP